MSQGLHLSQRLSQQMILSPQLQHSLALLQAPILELKAMIQQELQQNPILEETASLENSEDERELREEAAHAADPAEPPTDVQFDPATEKPEVEPVDRFDADMQRLMQLDQEWRDHFSANNVPSKSSPEDEERRQFMFDSLVSQTSLSEHLFEQVRMSDLTPEQRPVAEMVIGNIDDRGYLQSGIPELSFATGIAAEQIETVLKVIQTFDPPGVAARSLRECLMLQLERIGKMDSIEGRILADHFDALSRRRFPEIARALNRSVTDIQTAAESISRLDPHPGGEFQSHIEQYVIPEVTVLKNGDDFQVTHNSDLVPHLRISNHYKDLLSQAETNPEVREYIREKIKSGKFLIKSLHQRQSTIVNIANEIVKRQREFFENGASHLRPMTMLQVAEIVGVHETTVSRAVSGKYMQTPTGIFELKYFFTSGVQTSSGENISNTSIKGLVDETIKVEDRSKPLSDEELVAILKEKGITIARRTVAKYRTELGHLPSHLRRTYG